MHFTLHNVGRANHWAFLSSTLHDSYLRKMMWRPTKDEINSCLPKRKVHSLTGPLTLSTANTHSSSAPPHLYGVARHSSWPTCFSTGKFKIRAQGIMQIKT